MAETFLRESRIEAPAADVYAWHGRPGALDRLVPPFARVRVLERPASLEAGARAVLRVKTGPVWRTWVAEHREGEPGRSFRDVQVSGPFARWEHEHVVEPEGEGASRLVDRVEWTLPLGALGRLLGGRTVRRDLARTFAYRHRTTAEDVLAHREAGLRPLRIGVSGASGLLGSALVPFLTTGGHEVVRLARRIVRLREVEGLDAVVHLAGESVSGRWTRAKKERIRESRVEGTRNLVEALRQVQRPPEVLVSASAIGLYGSRGDEVLGEGSPPGEGFLADVASGWERAARSLEGAGVRVVCARFGVVLSPRGGALQRMLAPFRAGVGGRIGSGRQWWSWVAVDDAVGAIHKALADDSLRGAMNVVAPQPATNREFTRTLARVLRRPAVLPVPRLGVRLLFGEMGETLLLRSQRVEPRALLAHGYRFRFPDLEGALRHVLGRCA